MLATASIGLLINRFAAWTLYRTSRHSINVEGAFWHIVADLMGSIAVVISGFILLVFEWDLVDPILGVLIAALILFGSCRLALKVFRIPLEDAPMEGGRRSNGRRSNQIGCVPTMQRD